jgi:quinol monooxygenase YgiN
MFITITTNHPSQDEWKIIKPFMVQFIPRLRKIKGVHAVYFSYREEKNDETTFIVWENPQSIQSYRESALFQEAVEFEKKYGLSSTRDGFPVEDPS